MSIKTAILESLDSDTCNRFDINRDKIAELCEMEAGSDDQFKAAHDIIENILNYHGKDNLLTAIKDLSVLENFIREGYTRIKIRDHVIHSVYTYCIGVHLIKNMHINVDPFCWKLAALLHDVGYPICLGFKISKQMQVMCSDLISELHLEQPPVKFTMRFPHLSRLSDGRSALSLITSKLKKWGFPFTSGALYHKTQNDGKLNHGIIGAVFLCKCLEALYRKHNNDMFRERYPDRFGRDWNYDNFYGEIIEVCTSIFLHSLAEHDGVEELKLDLERHPLPFLLRLSDELQDWERPGVKQNDNSAVQYDLIFDSPRNVKVIVPPDKVNSFNNVLTVFSGVEFNVKPFEKN